jgi:phage terminase large subunit-like protein
LLASEPEELVEELLQSLPKEKARKLRYLWEFWPRHKGQIPPPGDWRVWLLLAGRGFGKTRTGAEYVRAQVEAGLARRIALVGPTALDARAVMVEGESGLLSVGPPHERPEYEPSLHRLTWKKHGAVATLFSADEPNRLRGPQHDLAWCDELAAWRYPQAWDMLMFGLRLAADPRCVVTSTPRPIKLIRELLADPKVVVTRGRTVENAKHLAGVSRPDRPPLPGHPPRPPGARRRDPRRHAGRPVEPRADRRRPRCCASGPGADRRRH